MSMASRPVGEATHDADLGDRAGPEDQVDVVVVAAGGGTRMAGVDKVFAPILGVPLIAHTVEAFEASPLVRSVVLTLPGDKLEQGRALARERRWRKVTSVSSGGARRQDSVRLGLWHLPGDHRRWVAVHDGARPCLEPDVLERGLDAVKQTGAAVAAVPAKDTIKVVSELGEVEATPARHKLWTVQTPQVFEYDLLIRAHHCCQEIVTDDAAMVEQLGHPVRVFMGSYTNLKVTTTEDIPVAELFLGMMKRLGKL